MPTTASGIQYPSSSDNVNLWEHFQALASTVEAALPQAGSTSAGMTVESGFTLVTFTGRTWGKVCTVTFLVTSNNQIVSTSGNFADVPMCTLPAGYRPQEDINSAFGTGITTGECLISSAGLVTLRSASDNIGAGNNVRVHTTFILA